MTPPLLSGIAVLAEQFDVFIVDLWGTLFIDSPGSDKTRRNQDRAQWTPSFHVIMRAAPL